MKILWITQIMLPEASFLLNGVKELKSTGGWIVGAAESLVRNRELKLSIAIPTVKVNELKCLEGEYITYYFFPIGSKNRYYHKEYEKWWHSIKDSVNPDVVHIHGTESCLGLSYVNACGREKVVVSLQGLRSQISRHYFAGISIFEVICSSTIHDLFKGGMIKDVYDNKRLGKLEIELIRKVPYVIGRTYWDSAHVWAINPNVEYLFCNETLRPEFYQGDKWNYNECQKYTIFLSQAGYPLKALHQVLKAMPLILRHFPDASIKVAGYDITQSSGLYGLRHFTGYGKYIKKLICKYNLQEKVTFTGALDGNQMKQAYLNCNVFICPSSLENSSNSIGEAQILGVPCLASYVGGDMDLMKGNEENLYRFEEIEMLAEKVCRIFNSKDEQVDMHNIAYDRHNPEINCQRLYNIYKKIISDNI